MKIDTDYFISTNSKRDADGNLIYYPVGILGRGYKVPSYDCEYKLCASAARFSLIGMPLFVLVAAYVSFASAISGLVIIIVILHILSWRTYRAWEIVDERLKYKEVLVRKNERVKGTIFYLIWCLSCLVFILGAEFLWLKIDDGYIPIVLVLISLIGAIFSWKVLTPSH